VLRADHSPENSPKVSTAEFLLEHGMMTPSCTKDEELIARAFRLMRAWEAKDRAMCHRVIGRLSHGKIISSDH